MQVSLARTGLWLRSLGRVAGGLQARPPTLDRWVEQVPSGFGLLGGIRHSARLGRTPAAWTHPSQPPGASQPRW